MHEVTRRRADFPDTAIGLAALVDGGLDDLHQEIPVILVRLHTLLAPAPGQLYDEPVHIQLKLLAGRVADTHRFRAAPALEPIERDLGETALAIDSVENL